jgi:hypothetical protein
VRLAARQEKLEKNNVVAALLSLQDSQQGEHCQQPQTDNYPVHASSADLEPLTKEVETQTEMTMDSLNLIMEESERLLQENLGLKQKLQGNSLNEAWLKDDDEKVLFYTGLPNWLVLLTVFDLIKNFLSHSAKSCLTPFQQLLLTLMRLRLDLCGKDLGYRFGIHETTVSRVFLNVLNILYIRMSPLIIWPDREALRKTIPMDFRKHCPKCVVIIDCFEIFLERAENVLARAQTHSSYKHHNTVKYLIGITPQGTVSFISDGWGGRVSDKHLTECSGLLNKLIPGDVILADRGFDIQESIGLYCAMVKIPAFTKGKRQLSGIEVEQTRRIANIRIHVERVIGNIRKKYAILNSTQPINFVMSKNEKVTKLDKMVTCCCALANLCDSVVCFD